jgi:hypothetical protein
MALGIPKEQRDPKIEDVSTDIRKKDQLRAKEKPRPTEIWTIKVRMEPPETARRQQTIRKRGNTSEREEQGPRAEDTKIRIRQGKEEQRTDVGPRFVIHGYDSDAVRTREQRGIPEKRRSPSAINVSTRKGKGRAYQSCTDDPRTPIDTRTIEDYVDKRCMVVRSQRMRSRGKDRNMDAVNRNVSEKKKGTNRPRTKSLGNRADETEPRPDTTNINKAETTPTKIAAVTNPSMSTGHQKFLGKARESENSPGTISTIKQWGTPQKGFSNPRPAAGIDESTDKTNAVARASALGTLKQKRQQRQQTYVTNLGHLWFGILEPQNDWRAAFRTAMSAGRGQERP